MGWGAVVALDLDTTREWMVCYRDGIERRADELNRLDAALGDGDFGASMGRGMDAVSQALVDLDASSIGDLLKVVGSTLVSAMGGTSGPLVGTLFLRMGMDMGDISEADVPILASGLRSGAEGVMALGQASLGDKTMIDSLLPAVELLEASTDVPFGTAIATAATVAREAAEATSGLVARRGRASYVGGGGLGHVDPGAVGVSILFDALDLAVNRGTSGGS